MKQGKKFILTEKILNHAWQLHCNGLTDKEIAFKLRIHPVTFSIHKIKFLKYYARQNRKLRKKSEGRPEGSSKLDRYRTACVKLAALGESVRMIAKQVGLPESTLRAWMEMDETFGHEMETAADNLDERIIKSLARRCEGYKLRDVTITEVSGGMFAGTQRTVTRSIRHVLPNVKAQEVWLTNRRKWLSENQDDGNANEKEQRPVEYEVVSELFDSSKSNQPI